MYLGHGSQQMLDVSKLAVMVGQGGFDRVDQELQRLSTGLQLLLTVLLRPSLHAQPLL